MESAPGAPSWCGCTSPLTLRSFLARWPVVALQHWSSTLCVRKCVVQDFANVLPHSENAIQNANDLLFKFKLCRMYLALVASATNSLRYITCTSQEKVHTVRIPLCHNSNPKLKLALIPGFPAKNHGRSRNFTKLFDTSCLLTDVRPHRRRWWRRQQQTCCASSASCTCPDAAPTCHSQADCTSRRRRACGTAA